MPVGVEKRRERRRRRLSEDLAVVRRRWMGRIWRARMRGGEGGDLGSGEEGSASGGEASGGGGSLEGIVVVDGWSGEDSIMCDAPEDSGSIELDAWGNSVREGG